MRFAKLLGRRMRPLDRMRRDEDGASTVEFVLVFPIFITLVLTVFEAGWLMSKSMFLDRGLEIAMRDVRLGDLPETEVEAAIKSRICNNALLLRDCNNVLVLEMKPIVNSASFPSDDADCVERTTGSGGELGYVKPQSDFNPGGRSELMFVRACVLIDPIFPGIGLGLQLPKDSSGAVQMTAMSAFINEPE